MKEIKIKDSNEVIYTFNTSTNLPVYMWVNDKKKNTYMGLGVKYGSSGIKFKCNNVEYTVPTGIAHFLEHIKFHLQDQDASELFLDLGCDSNAYTSFKETVFEVYANDNIYEAAKLLLDFVYNDYFSKKMIENERGIILEEANSNKDNPNYEFYIKFLDNYFQNSNCKYPVIGTEKDIKQISIEDIKLVYDFFYRPENMFLVITGNFDPNIMQQEIMDNEAKRTFKRIDKVEIIAEEETEKLNTNKYELRSINCKNTKARLTFKTSFKKFKKLNKQEVILSLRCLFIAKYGLSSDFYEDITQNGLVTDFYTLVSYDSGVIGVEFNYFSEKPNKVKNLIIDSLKDLKIDEEELSRVKRFSKAQFIMKFDNIYKVASSMIYNIIENDTPNMLDMSVVDSLTVKKINNVFKYINQDNYIYGVLKQKNE